ncbi:cytidylate kinase [Roseimaritima multifibrata]|uniref:Cytidylate kinase n=1 Tax=Roseimaritima multifibrata TaxID=1930274 RepID=A0A517MBF1_9BACT|nr:cytidylate kinase-like family protein [Roseimaritima multifibrata]QDS92205.1 cytidylate kinase [Roseimaritima multifibrata]
MTALHIAAIEKRAEQKIRKWVEAEHSRERLAKADVSTSVGPYLMLSRETGAAGSEIAQLVGQQLHWDVLDKEIIDYMAEHYGTSRSLIEVVDEKHSSWLGDIFNSWIDGNGFSSAAYMNRLNRLFLLAAHHGRVVIVGRGSRYLLPREGGLSIRIVAPLNYRIARIAAERQIGPKEARKFVEHSDKEQAAFIKDHFHHQCADPHEYDLVINMENRTPQDAADFIAEAARRWMQVHAGEEVQRVS